MFGKFVLPVRSDANLHLLQQIHALVLEICLAVDEMQFHDCLETVVTTDRILVKFYML